MSFLVGSFLLCQVYCEISCRVHDDILSPFSCCRIYPLQTFATLSPIPGYMQWLLSKLAPTEISDSTFSENLQTPEEESALLEATK